MPIIDRHLVFCLLIMSDKKGEEDPKVISVGSFEDLRSYFGQKFSHLKRELSDDQLKSSSSLVKKLKTETNLRVNLHNGETSRQQPKIKFCSYSQVR